MTRVIPATLGRAMSHRDQARLVRALGVAEARACAGDVSAREALSIAAQELEVHEGTLALLFLEKIFQCARARDALQAAGAHTRTRSGEAVAGGST